MKILYISPWFPYPLDTGAKSRVYNLVRELSKRHEVTLLSFAHTASEQALTPVLLSFCSDVKSVQCNPFYRGKLLTSLRFFSPRPIVTFRVSEMTDLVRQVTSNDHFDVVIAFTSLVAPYILSLKNTAKVLDIDNSLTLNARERYRQQHSLLRRLQAMISWKKSEYYEAWVVRRFDACIALTPPDLADMPFLRERRSPSVLLLSNGVDLQFFSPSDKNPEPTDLIYPGSLTFDANFDAMVYFLTEIFPRIQAEIPDVTFKITGKTEGVALRDLPLSSNVTLTGYVTDIRPLVAQSWACVVPLRIGGGQRMKILEAMALGTPVVATSKGAEGLDVIDGVHILLADDPAAFADRTLQLLRNPELRQRLVTNARRLVEQRYDWAQIGRRFAELVEAVASKGVSERVFNPVSFQNFQKG